jgi:hypothetical protein
VTRTSFFDLGGRIPHFVQSKQGVGHMVYLSTMRKRFDKSEEVDAESNSRLVTMIRNHDEPYTEKEEGILRDGMAHFSKFDALKGKELKMDSALTKAKIAFEKGDGHAWGWAKSAARASPEHVLAHVLDYYRRSKDKSEKEVERSMKVVTDHNRELYQRYKSGLILGRDFLNRQIWRKLSDGSFVIVAAPIESEDHPLLPDVVRGRFPLAMRLRGTADGTAIESVIQIDFGGRVPALVTNLYVNEKRSEGAKEIAPLDPPSVGRYSAAEGRPPCPSPPFSPAAILLTLRIRPNQVHEVEARASDGDPGVLPRTERA